MDNNAALDFLVDRNDFSTCRWTEVPRESARGSAVLALRRFALTTNNVTYARCGDRLGFWRHFPGPPGWGRIPVWGVAEVVEPGETGLRAGEHVYGFMPISTRFTLHPIDLGEATFSDGAPHRSELPSTYSEYKRLGASSPADLHLVLRPLFSLSFFLAAFLRDNDFFGTRQVVVASASSKTALGLAFLIARERPASLALVGLTSPGHVDALTELGRYDRVSSYEDIQTIPALDSLFVDIAGDPNVTGAVHRHFGARLARSIAVGFTRSDGKEADPSLPGPTPEFFFAPKHILDRRKAWGPKVLQARLDEAWSSFREEIGRGLNIIVGEGIDTIEPVYRDVLGGRVPPTQAHVIALR